MHRTYGLALIVANGCRAVISFSFALLSVYSCSVGAQSAIVAAQKG